MEFDVQHGPAYALGVISLQQGEEIQAETGAMVSMSESIKIETGMKGGVLVVEFELRVDVRRKGWIGMSHEALGKCQRHACSGQGRSIGHSKRVEVSHALRCLILDARTL